MDKRIQKKLYEQAQAARRRFPPFLLDKKNASLMIKEIIMRNEKTINWKMYEDCKIPTSLPKNLNLELPMFKALCTSLGDHLTKGISDADMERFLIDITPVEVMFFVYIKKLSVFHTDHGSGYYLESNKIGYNDKIVILSTHAMDRITERALIHLKRSESRFFKHLIRTRIIETMKVYKCYDNKLEVFIPMPEHLQKPDEIVYHKIGYLVLSEERDNYYYAKSFVLPGFMHTPEAKLIKKPWEDMNEDDIKEVHKTIHQFISLDKTESKDSNIKDYDCITSAWKKFIPQ